MPVQAPSHPEEPIRDDDGDRMLRVLSSRGLLSDTYRGASEPVRSALHRAAYRIVWPIVFRRLTRAIEMRRGHMACATSVTRLAGECLDHFHNDVESVVDDLFMRANQPIRSLEGFITSHITVATIDGYRRRRGERGALQRPRVPGWLAAALGEDPWLVELAKLILTWAGVEMTAGLEVWPLHAWAVRRSDVRGLGNVGELAEVRDDVNTVIDAMRTREQWYLSYVERPLSRKQTSVLGAPAMSTGRAEELRPFLFVTRDEVADGHLNDLAHAAIGAIRTGLRQRREPLELIVDVVRTTFAGDIGADDIDRPPHEAGHHRHIEALMADESQMRRVVAAILRIIGDAEEGDLTQSA